MKEITYTRLRQDLAKVLDEIRSGEEFLVTQRGKEPVILASNKEGVAKEQVNIALDGSDKNNIAGQWLVTQDLLKDFALSLMKNMNSSDSIERKMQDIVNSMNEKKFETIRKTIKLDAESYFKKNKISVEDAVKEVRVRHAKTIKALEDK